MSLPEVIQSPDCKHSFDLFYLQVSSDTLDTVLALSAINFDQTSRSITITTYDKAFVGSEVLLTVTIDQQEVFLSGSFTVNITFVQDAPSQTWNRYGAYTTEEEWWLATQEFNAPEDQVDGEDIALSAATATQEDK